MTTETLSGQAALCTPDGCPYAIRDEVSFSRDEVAAIGKVQLWGSFVTRYVLRLLDGRQVFCCANKQAKDNERWLRKLAAKVPYRPVSRETGWAVAWHEIKPQAARAFVDYGKDWNIPKADYDR